MVQIFGDFNEKSIENSEFLMLGFSPNSVSTKRRWENNSLSADFLADYLTTFVPIDDNDPTTSERQEELEGAVSYIANELLENAMKFSSEQFYPVSLQVHLYDDHLVLSLTNSISQKNLESFQEFLEELLNNDPQELYIRRMQKLQLDDNQKISRLGLLTMINDYNAKIGWKFESFPVEEQARDNQNIYKINQPILDKQSFFSRLLSKLFFNSNSQNSEVVFVTTMVQLDI